MGNVVQYVWRENLLGDYVQFWIRNAVKPLPASSPSDGQVSVKLLRMLYVMKKLIWLSLDSLSQQPDASCHNVRCSCTVRIKSMICRAFFACERSYPFKCFTLFLVEISAKENVSRSRTHFRRLVFNTIFENVTSWLCEGFFACENKPTRVWAYSMWKSKCSSNSTYWPNVYFWTNHAQITFISYKMKRVLEISFFTFFFLSPCCIERQQIGPFPIICHHSAFVVCGQFVSQVAASAVR